MSYESLRLSPRFLDLSVEHTTKPHLRRDRSLKQQCCAGSRERSVARATTPQTTKKHSPGWAGVLGRASACGADHHISSARLLLRDGVFGAPSPLLRVRVVIATACLISSLSCLRSPGPAYLEVCVESHSYLRGRRSRAMTALALISDLT